MVLFDRVGLQDRRCPLGRGGFLGGRQGSDATSRITSFFRQALWMYLEDIVANVFAQILAVVDANNNLDHIFQGAPLAELWLQMFQEETVLKIKYTSK